MSVFSDMLPFKNALRLKSFIAIFIALFCLNIVVFQTHTKSNFYVIPSPLIDIEDRNVMMDHTELIISAYSSDSACEIPYLPANSDEMLKFVKYVPPITCNSVEQNWVTCKGSVCSLTRKPENEYEHIECSYTDVLRVNDFKNTDAETTITITESKFLNNSHYVLTKSDVVKVSCKSEYGAEWKSVLTGIRFDKNTQYRTNWKKIPKGSFGLNVLMFGLGSMSRNTFIRTLPKTYKYLTAVLNGLVLQGYNIVGGGKSHALTPILTGHTELELPDVRKRFNDTGFLDEYPFVWNNFHEHGYATAYLEDAPESGIYTSRLNGFKKAPTDYYMRPYYLEASNFFEDSQTVCIGSEPKHKVMMNQIKNFFEVYKTKRKFLFGFLQELSQNNYNFIGGADDDILAFITDLHHSGILNNTIFILMSDHGTSAAEIRSTMQGKQEERLPFFSFMFPPSFPHKHKQIYENVVTNINRLTTPFDIHATLMDILSPKITDNAGILKRSLSLFSKIPAERSCLDAHIEPHWCTCLDRNAVSSNSSISTRLGEILVNFLNTCTKSHRDLCEVLILKELKWVNTMVSNQYLRIFLGNADVDGFIGASGVPTKLTYQLYQIKIVVEPGDSVFEANITHFIDEDRFEVKVSDKSRVNASDKQIKCTTKMNPHLRKYCYCKE